jgi:hypothetical protein
MIGRHEHEIINDQLAHGLFHGPKEPKTRGETTAFLRLSAKMVDLSLHHTRDSLVVDIPARVPSKSDCYPPEATVQLPQASVATIVQNEAKKPAQVEHSGFVEASPNLRVRIHALPMWFSSLAILVLTVLAFGVVYGFLGYHQDSFQGHSQITTAVQQRENPVPRATTIASENAHNHGNTPARSKPKSHRRRDDYIAKDTYVYYGNDGKSYH